MYWRKKFVDLNKLFKNSPIISCFKKSEKVNITAKKCKKIQCESQWIQKLGGGIWDGTSSPDTKKSKFILHTNVGHLFYMGEQNFLNKRKTN